MEIHLMLTHVHWDHIQGLPFFKLLYRPGTALSLYGPDYENLERFLQHQMYPSYFPVSMDHADVKASLSFYPLDTAPTPIGQVTVRHHFVNHGAERTVAGYRVDGAAGSFVFIPDVEPFDYPKPGESKPIIDENNPIERELLAFVRNADLMLFDSTYTTEEYERCRGWGHSPVEYAVEVAARAGVRRLGLYHYDPIREDEEMDQIAELARIKGIAKGVDVFPSRENMVIPIGTGG
jgi:phosphoribosyl 1,2-cyclic phosphodiesterase